MSSPRVADQTPTALADAAPPVAAVGAGRIASMPLVAVWVLTIAAVLWLIPDMVVPGLGLACLVVVWAWLTPAARAAPFAWRAALVGLATMSCVALYPSVDLDVSLPRLDGIVLGLAIFGVLVHWLDSERRLVIAVVLLAALVVGVTGLGLIADWPTRGKGLALDAIYSHLPRWTDGVPYLGDRGLNPNKVAAPLAMLVPPAAAAGLYASRRSAQVTWALACLVMTCAVFLTQSRSAYLAVGGGLLLVLTSFSRRFALLFVPVVALVLWVAMWGFGPRDLVAGWPAPPMLGGGASTLDAGRQAADYTLSSRLQVWDMARDMVGDFPLTGIGLGTFPQVAQTLYGPAYSEALPLFGQDAEVPHAHNLALQVAIDLGLPGLGFFCLLTGCLAVAARRAMAGARSPRARGLAVGAVGGLLAYYLFGVTDVIGLGEKPSLIFWVLLAIVVGCSRFGQQPGGQRGFERT